MNSIELFTPVDVKLSATGTGTGGSAVNFNSSTLNLTCSASPITAVLSSTPDSRGNLLVDNNINVTVVAGQTTTGPTNVCVGGVNGSASGAPFQNCFNSVYETAASNNQLTGTNPDLFLTQGGIPPIDISSNLVAGPVQLKIDFQDEGGYLTSSTTYLNTNCTPGGVTGPALITGNPISSTNPTPAQLDQDFSFNNTNGQQVGLEYDLTEAEQQGSLMIQDGSTPKMGDTPIDPSSFQSTYVQGTPFATTNCLVHAGELLGSGAEACKLYTLQCTIGTGEAASGAQCPVSSLPNEFFRENFDGPSFALSDYATPAGTFHAGVAFLMASEGWTGGPCSFDPNANLNIVCPQNLLTSFSSTADSNAPQVRASVKGIKANAAVAAASSSGNYTGSGRTTHPNSSFIEVAGVPEPLTSITSTGASLGADSAYWFKGDPTLSFSVQPPALGGTSYPGATTFVASPIESLTYGVSTAAALPEPGDAIPTDTILKNTTCPTTNGNSPTAPVYAPGLQTISGLGEGQYLLHYFAQDCAGTEELKFSQDGAGFWSTDYYTYPLNVDRSAPSLALVPRFQRCMR